MFEFDGETIVQSAECCTMSDGKCVQCKTSMSEPLKEDGLPAAKRQKPDRKSVEDLLIIQKEQIDHRFTILKREGDLFYVSF